MQLKELEPRTASFVLKATGKEYFLKAITPADGVLIEKQIGNLKEKLAEGRVQDLFKMAFLLLTPESSMDFVKRKIKYVNLEGESVEREEGGLTLFVNMMANVQEQISVMKACLVSVGFPDEYIEKLFKDEDKVLSMEVDDIENFKKKVNPKNPKKKRIGRR